MKLELMRYTGDTDSTGGILMVNGKFHCFTCEDEHRDVKVAGETRIPNGTYKITLRNEGGMTKRYAARFGSDFHRGMLWLRDVLDFKWVYIHPGNTDDDTNGCILVGYSGNRTNKENTVSRSTAAYKDLYKMILDAMDKGEEVTISVWEMAR